MIFGELLAHIVAAFFQLIVYILSLVFSSAYLAAHEKGAARVFGIIASLSALHLFLGLILPFFGSWDILILSTAFNRWAMLTSLVLLIFSLAANTAVHQIQPERRTTPSANAPLLSRTGVDEQPMFIFSLIIVAVLMGGTSIFSAQIERKSLRERMCDDVTGRISQEWKDRGEVALSWTERVLKRDLSDKIPCVPENK